MITRQHWRPSRRQKYYDSSFSMEEPGRMVVGSVDGNWSGRLGVGNCTWHCTLWGRSTQSQMWLEEVKDQRSQWGWQMSSRMLESRSRRFRHKERFKELFCQMSSDTRSTAALSFNLMFIHSLTHSFTRSLTHLFKFLWSIGNTPHAVENTRRHKA
jgi:hypothetical protein